MTELQMGMIGFGIFAVAGVIGYNKWQEYRHRKAAEAVLPPRQEDILLDAGDLPPSPDARLEPDFSDEQQAAPALREDPVFDEAPPAVVPEEPPPQAMAPPPSSSLAPALDDVAPAPSLPLAMLDQRIEYVVAMELVDSVPARQILSAQKDALARLAKPVHWIGFNDVNREWERLQADGMQPISRLRVGLQLCNRLGPLSEADLAVFVMAMRALAEELMVVVDLPEKNVLAQAAEVDRFCAAVDLEIGINLISRGLPFSGTKIRALAEASGMALGLNGLFTRYDEEGRAQFSLQNYETAQFSLDNIRGISTHGLTFLLDVPRVTNGERVFMQMTELAKRFADALQGALVDDNRQPLGEPQLEHIRREFIGKPQAAMASFGLPAGSPQALRLFS
ncbi:MAG: cell division protein ZipA C-terminal FtsZ-binding domain-containing protein [Azonexus sp.]|nr:cell division protein ZipA C-terminal FtsZ-binding domain-containing protein [Azonexus sp.]MCK6412628.1 cell division protein ZipA C-terminal FtsZ-binding domain-containing protein [Azonexus sp.]